MKFLFYFIALVCNLSVATMSLHYIKIKNYNYFIPEMEIFNLAKENFETTILQIRKIELALLFILIITLYIIGFRVFNRRRNFKSLIIISNVFFAISFIFFMFVLPTQFFENLNHNTKIILHLITNIFLLNSILLNIYYITNLTSGFSFLEYKPAILFPPFSLYLLRKDIYLDSNVVLWAYQNNTETYFKVDEMRNMQLNDSTLVWFKGIPDWVLYQDLKNAKNIESLRNK